MKEVKKAEERQRDILRKIDEQLLLYENQRGTGSDAGRTAVRVPVVTATEGECVENVYDRNKLYEEVWAEPVSKVAIKYGVSDVMIHKICKQMNIPVPPRGYWAKKNAGKKVEKARLPAKSDVTVIYGNGSQCVHAPCAVLPLLCSFFVPSVIYLVFNLRNCILF